MTNNKQQTPVEWFFMTMNICGLLPTEEIVEYYNQAKAMEKEKMIDAIIDCEKEHYMHSTVYPPQCVIDKAEQYYKQTYGGNNGKEVK